jgi:hypothetical protein
MFILKIKLLLKNTKQIPGVMKKDINIWAGMNKIGKEIIEMIGKVGLEVIGKYKLK